MFAPGPTAVVNGLSATVTSSQPQSQRGRKPDDGCARLGCGSERLAMCGLARLQPAAAIRREPPWLKRGRRHPYRRAATWHFISESRTKVTSGAGQAHHMMAACLDTRANSTRSSGGRHVRTPPRPPKSRDEGIGRSGRLAHVAAFMGLEAPSIRPTALR